MDDFSSETFVEAAHILDTYGVDASRAAGVLRRVGALHDNADMLDAPDTSRLRQLLSRLTPTGRVYCIIGGLSRQGDSYQLNVVHYTQILYLLHSDIASMRTHIDVLRRGPVHDALIRMILQDRIDAIRFRSRVLAEMMLHLSRIAAHPLLPGMMLRLGNLAAPPPAAEEEERAAQAQLQTLIRDYLTRIGQAGEELKSVAFDVPKMEGWLREFPANPLPLWIVWPDEPDSRVLDDVWIPKPLFEPIMQMLTGQASAALAIPLPVQAFAPVPTAAQ